MAIRTWQHGSSITLLAAKSSDTSLSYFDQKLRVCALTCPEVRGGPVVSDDEAAGVLLLKKHNAGGWGSSQAPPALPTL